MSSTRILNDQVTEPDPAQADINIIRFSTRYPSTAPVDRPPKLKRKKPISRPRETTQPLPQTPDTPAPPSFLRLAGILVLVLLLMGGSFALISWFNKPGPQPPQRTSAQMTATARVQSTSGASATARVVSTVGAIAAATARAQSMATAQAQATSVAIARAGHPYGGTLAISDPMLGPGSPFGWATIANNGQNSGNQCNFENDGYHVLGICPAQGANNGSKNIIPSEFALQVDLDAVHSCGELDFEFDNDDNAWFSASVCQNGYYNLSDSLGDKQQGSTPFIHTGANESNEIAVVADGSTVTLYINSFKVQSIPDSVTQPGYVTLIGEDLASVFSGNAFHPNDYRWVTYSNALLWSL